MPRLPSALAEPRNPIRAIAVGWALSLAGSLALAALSQLLVPNLGTPEFPALPPLLTLFMLVVFAPVVETLIMAAALELMLVLRIPAAMAIAASAAGWGVAHGLEALGWGLVIWWPFLIFSTLYVVWRQRSIWAGLGVAAATHALQNLGPALFLLGEAGG
ncbi:MAG TPA: hypothetical protein VNJ05_08965 [Sphingomicrobium sp.]|nr:hypothetical protein [Sphingomicrobium sp.]